MLMQQFCDATGLSRDTVRFYVRQGLLRPAVGTATGGTSRNRYQVFDAGHVERARVIRTAQALGFSLREVAALARTYEQEGLTSARRAAILREHLSGLDARLALLTSMRAYVHAKMIWLQDGARGPEPCLPESTSNAPPWAT
jgi:MerR family transcriptional regulator, copper efflux regulator